MHRVEAYKILGIPVSSSDEADYLLEKMIKGDIEKAKRVELVTVRGKNKVFQRKQLVGKKEDDSPKLRGSKLFKHLGSNRYSDKEIDSTIKDYFGSQGKSFTYSDKIQRKFVLQFLENTEEVIKKLPKNHFAGNDYLKSVDLRFWDRSGIAAYEDTKKRIVFSRDVIKSVANDKITDITDKLELQSIFAHEIGHSVWEKFTQLSKGEKNIDKLKEFNKICGWGYQDPTAYEMSSSTGFAKRKRRVETDIERLITPYAETNSQEAFSEYYAFYALNRKLVDELISAPFRTNQSKKIPFRGGEEVSYKKIVDSKPVFAWMKENIFENKHFEKALEDDIEKGMSERERENRWHEMFYALQREGHSSESAAKIATSKYGSHSDKKRTKEDHMRTYKHLHQTTEEIEKAKHKELVTIHGKTKTFQQLREVNDKELKNTLKIENNYTDTIVNKLQIFDEKIKNKEFPSVAEFVDRVLPSRYVKEYKELYELAAELRIKVDINKGIVPLGMVASWGMGSINIDPQIAKIYCNNWDEFVESINHEIIHGFISRGIAYDNFDLHSELRPIVVKIQEEFDRASDDVKQTIAYIIDTSKEFNAKKFDGDKVEVTPDYEELITYAFTDKAFAEFLDSIPFNVEGTKKISIFSKLKNIVRGYFKKATKPTALDKINEVLNKYFDVDWQIKNYNERAKKYGWKEQLKVTNVMEKSEQDEMNPNGGTEIEAQAKVVNNKKQFADVLIFNENDELLLLKRTLRNDFEPLKWCLPGGHIDIGETPEIAAKREVFEETGVEVTELYPVYIYETPEVKINYFEANYVDSEIHLIDEEHSNYVFTSDWYDYDLLMNLRDNLEKIINIRINELEKALDNIDIEKAIKGQLNRSRLVKKTIVDKNGKRVTKWVKPSEIEAPEKIRKPQEQKVDGKKSEKIEPKKIGEKKPEEYAKQTKTSDLEKYIKKPNSDEKLKNIAKEEIQKRKDGKSKEPTKTSGNKEERPKVEKPKRKEKFYDGLVKKYKLSRTPKDYVKKEDVIIDETDPENHWIMRWTEINERTGKPKVMTSYSQSFLDKNKEKKFERIRKIKPVQIELVKKQAVKMIDNEDSNIAQSAAIIAIIAHTGLRPGDRKGFLDTGNRGVSTLGASNILIDGDEIRFDFTGKSYKENKAFIKDAKLAEYLDKLKKEKMGEEFIFDVSKSKIVNVFHNKLNFKGFKLKDMRTYVACDVAKNILFTDKTPPPPLSNTKTAIKKEITAKIRKVCEIVAEKLNNTPTMAKSSYIDPKVFDAWLFSLGVQPELIQKAMDGEVISLQDIIKNNQESQVVDTDEYNDFDDELNDDVDEYPVPDWMDLDEPEQKLKNYLIKKEGEEVSKAELISLFEEVGLGNKTIETILKTNNSKE